MSYVPETIREHMFSVRKYLRIYLSTYILSLLSVVKTKACPDEVMGKISLLLNLFCIVLQNLLISACSIVS